METPIAMPPVWQVAYSRFRIHMGNDPDLSNEQDAYIFMEKVTEVMQEERDKALDDALVAKITNIVLQRVEEGMTERIFQRIEKEEAEAVEDLLKEMQPGGSLNFKEMLRED